MSKKRIHIKPTEEIRKVHDNIDAWVRGQEVQETTRFTIELPLQLHKIIKRTCVDEGISMKDKILEILTNVFQK